MVINIVQKTIDVGDIDGNIKFKHPERYTDISYIGGGSFGRVVCAIDSRKDTKIIIKKMAVRDKKHIRNILREIIIMRSACNIHVAKQHLVYMDTNDGLLNSVYIVMENCGINLITYLNEGKNKNRLTLNKISEIIYSLAKGLNFLHALGVYHRDLKPANVCVNIMNENFPAKIIDLGYARVKPRESSEVTGGIATLCYRAPESLLNLKYHEELDVWSLGCIYGYLLTKKHLFYNEKGGSTGVISKVFETLGAPPKTFIDKVEQGKEKRKVSANCYMAFEKFLEEYCQQEPKLGSLFHHELYTTHELKSSGVALLEGMLKWDPSDRFKIRNVLESEFLADIRHQQGQIFELLPEKDLRDEVTENLRIHEEAMKNLKSEEELKKYLVNFISDKFPTYPDSDNPEDYFLYDANKVPSKALWCLTAAVLGSVCVPLIMDNSEPFYAKLMAVAPVCIFGLKTLQLLDKFIYYKK